jgi:predicted outer membrane repeat protein
VVIHDNYIHDNKATAGNGGGVYADLENRCELQITDNRVYSNTAVALGVGGGIYARLLTSGTLTLDNNEIVSNTATGSGGFHARIWPFGRFSVDGNEVISNTATGVIGGFNLNAEGSSSGTCDDNDVIGNRANSHGGGHVTLWYNASSTFHGNEFKGNKALSTDYGGLYLEAYHNSHVTGSKLVLEDNFADRDYGGGYVDVYYNSSVALPNTKVRYNEAGGDTGGLYLGAVGYSRLDAPSLEVISNTSHGDGGGAYAYVDDGSRMDLSEGTYKLNRALESGNSGGGLYVDEVYKGSWLDLSGSEFYTNTAGTGGDSDGGGVYVYEIYYGSTLVMSGTTFISNTAQSDGGGVFLNLLSEGSRVEADGSTFERNRAINGNGGAFSLDSNDDDCYFSLSGGSFVENKAGSDGGAFQCSDDLADGGEAYLNDNTFSKNEADGSGGAVYVEYLTYYGGYVEVNNNRVLDNKAKGNGGGIEFYEVYEGGYAEVVSNTITGNESGGNGGGVHIDDVDGGCYLVVDGNTISSNHAGSDGGGFAVRLFVNGGSVMEFTNNRVNDNYSKGNGGGFEIWDYIDRGTLVVMRGNEFLRNTAEGSDGGCGIQSAQEGARIVFEDNWVNYNVAWESVGGCQFHDFGKDGATALYARNNEFNYNRAGEDYGGVSIDQHYDGALVEFVGNDVIGNRAGMTGTVATATGGDVGGLFLDLEAESKAVFEGNMIDGNIAYAGTSSGDCGGMYAEVTQGSLLVMEDNAVIRNEAKANFGGLRVDLLDASRLEMEHNVLEANTAVAESGGVHIYGIGDSQYFLWRNKILDNAAAAKGGLWIENGDTTDPLWGISENNLVAGNVGSGIFLYNADFHSRNDTLADNGAYGIRISGTGTISLTAWLSNTIVWNHTNSFVNDDSANYAFRATDSDIQGGAVFPGAGNINLNPLFVNAAANNYHLQQTSPAVDKVPAVKAPRTDLDGIPRPVGLAADMGCYEWFQVGVSLAPTPQASTEKPGTTAVYNLTVTNDGDLPDTFQFTVPITGLGWLVAVDPVSVTLAAGASAAVQVQVSVPADADAGLENEITVQATSQADATKIAIANIKTTVALVPLVSIEPDRAASVPAGTTATYQHAVTNLGNGTETFLLSTASSQGWTATVSPAAVTLLKSASVTVTVQVAVPAAAAVGTTDVTTVTATSLTDAGVSDSAEDTTTSEAGIAPGPVRVYLPIMKRSYP